MTRGWLGQSDVNGLGMEYTAQGHPPSMRVSNSIFDLHTDLCAGIVEVFMYQSGLSDGLKTEVIG
jgi:hypothetical protein